MKAFTEINIINYFINPLIKWSKLVFLSGFSFTEGNMSCMPISVVSINTKFGVNFVSVTPHVF